MSHTKLQWFSSWDGNGLRHRPPVLSCRELILIELLPLTRDMNTIITKNDKCWNKYPNLYTVSAYFIISVVTVPI